MRCFFGIPLPEAARQALTEATAALRAGIAGREARWVPPENLHLTLRFLGEASRSQIHAVTRCAESVIRGMEAPELRFGTPGVFPPRGSRPLVLWVGLEGQVSRVAGLARALEDCAREAGFPAERRPFRAHVTLARLRGAAARSLSDGLLPAVPPAACRPEALHLFRSVFREDGVEYTTIGAWGFSRPPAAPKMPE